MNGLVYRDTYNEEVYCELRYQGQLYDAETGLYYNRHRYYDAESGQYLSPDPIGLHGGNRPQAYVHNPLEWGDPLGLAKAACPKKVDALRTGGKNTTVEVRTKAEADELLREAFPDYQKVNGVGSQDAQGARKKRKMDRFKQGGAYHKDYGIDPATGRVRGHGPNDEHGRYPHINIKRRDGIKVVINIVGGA
ncbi:hypothetical protein BSK69_19075 [Pectobacterium actinidiae]|nr:RHS repeat-associated core domain-containing protein [Pectobacterium actinidiae]KHN93117.1 hypothetical protein KKH3_31440 [Pectobacterium actinidiae]ONK01684.1 hypothetical protein BSK69_19075 [Pectobacterium actinidiae]